MTSAVAAVVLLATFTVVWTAPPNPCFRAQMPNDEDPYSFYKCDAGGKAHLWRCAAGTMYDRRTQICDWEDQVRGRNGQTGTGGGARPSNSGNRGRDGPNPFDGPKSSEVSSVRSGSGPFDKPSSYDGPALRYGPGSWSGSSSWSSSTSRAGSTSGKYYGYGGGSSSKKKDNGIPPHCHNSTEHTSHG